MGLSFTLNHLHDAIIFHIYPFILLRGWQQVYAQPVVQVVDTIGYNVLFIDADSDSDYFYSLFTIYTNYQDDRIKDDPALFQFKVGHFLTCHDKKGR